MKNILNKIFVFVASIIISILIVPKKISSVKFLLSLLIKIGLVSLNSKKIKPVVSKLLENFNISSPMIVGFVSGAITGISASQSIESTLEFIDGIRKRRGICLLGQGGNGCTGISVGSKRSVLADVLIEGVAGAFA